jgi:hypothetical protein
MLAEIVEDLVKDTKLCIVAPAIDVGGLDIEDFFSESFGNELRDAGFVGAAGSSDDGGVGGFPVRNGFEDAIEMVNFGVAMLNFPRDKPGAENASIADHLFLTD